ncbi:MAG TPA: RNA 2',3'-cyclic phosphodiesterase, partial [Armatimonadetes bacterium]|nr:RNA 2',3'-cyclic phosphodiesterase [Armatimonadota bacterium]
RGVGGFPNFKRPRVLWVGVDAPQALLDLQSRIENAFQQLGFERERRAFHPHITIGRVKAPQGISAVVQRLSKYENEMFGELHVQQITLMRSDLTPQGPIYTPLSHHQLSGHCN